MHLGTTVTTLAEGTGPTAFAWLTFGIAVVGAVTGVTALVWRAVEFRRSRPRVRVGLQEAMITSTGTVTGRGAWNAAGPGRPAAAVIATNIGREPTTVERVELLFGWVVPYQATKLLGPGLPYRLDAAESVKWWVDLIDAMPTIERVIGAMGRFDFGAGVRLGDGRYVTTRRRGSLRLFQREAGGTPPDSSPHEADDAGGGSGPAPGS